MTATMTQTSQAVGEWTKLFPKQVTENYTSSVTFLKQLTVVAVSTITYLKNIFPEDSYMVETFGGLKLRILKKKCEDELAQFLTTALTQAFDAFDKRYLHQLALCFYEDECKIENLIEYHIFEYSYNSDGVTMNIHSKNRDNVKRTQKCTFENVKERTIHMIRACVVIMPSQYDLPSRYDVSIRLYYNDDAPEGYQAPGFLSSENEDHLEPTLSETVKLGWVETPYHKLVARCYMKDSYRASFEAIASQNPPEMSQAEHDNFGTQRAGEIRCPCNKTDSDIALLTCWYCKCLQHAVCVGLRGEVSRQHCCEVCALADGTRSGTDPGLLELSLRKRECLCIFRRALDHCSRVSTIGATDIMEKFSFTETNAIKLMKLLYSHGIVDQSGVDDMLIPREIIPEQLKSVMTKFFQNSEEETIVNRLLAETFASQESQPDPVAEVLSPMEQITLQNASQLGRVIPTPVMNSNIEDVTLKQYRDAILSNINDVEEEMPLSGSHNPIQNMDDIGKRTTKRKISTEDRPNLRSGVRTKRAKAKV